MQKIIPHLWFDTQAREAADFYASVFPNAQVKSHSVLRGTPSGDCDVMEFSIDGYQFMSISAGPMFTINPSISFTVPCATADQVDQLYEKLMEGGKALMELGTYPWSHRYGWVADKYGVSWQIIMTAPGIAQHISPHLMFTQTVTGKAEEAINFYTSVFHNSKILGISKNDDMVMHALFQLEGQEFGAMDAGPEHAFGFNEGVSFMVMCDTQEEIDYFWEKLSAVPESEMCGWLKDKYGVSWQINPSRLQEMMTSGTPEQIDCVVQAFLQMKKFDIAKIEEAFRG